MKNDKKEFWVTNLANQSISLADLRLHIKPYTSLNLLSKHYHYTLEQLEKSAKEGSIYLKSKNIVVRQVAPQTIIKSGIYVEKDPRQQQGNLRSMVVVENKKLEEMLEDDDKILSDQKYVLNLLDEEKNEEGEKK